MVRKQFYITAEQDAKLKRLAADRGITEAELVRIALDGIDEVVYDRSFGNAAGKLREAATMEYAVNADTGALGGRSRAGRSLRGALAESAWQEELAFIKKLAGTRPGGGTIERFNRDEVYEERLSKLLP